MLEWLAKFRADNHRFPLLLVLVSSHMGKTELACSWFQNPLTVDVGPLGHFPDGVKEFTRKHHDGIVLDDVRDLQFLVRYQHVFQAKYQKCTEFVSSPTGQSAYSLYLYAVPFVVTANFSTANLCLLDTDDFLSKPQNCVVLRLMERPWEGAPLMPRALAKTQREANLRTHACIHFRRKPAATSPTPPAQPNPT